jgi:hypothetical protein
MEFLHRNGVAKTPKSIRTIPPGSHFLRLENSAGGEVTRKDVSWTVGVGDD